MPNALKKINARVKQLAKKHPNAKRKTLQKQAGREWKAGKLKAKRKPVARKKTVKRKAVKRKAVRKKISGKSLGVAVRKASKRRKRTTVYKARVIRKYSTVGKKSDSMVVPLMLVGAALILYLLLKPNVQQQYPGLWQSNNQQRNNSAANIIAYATAAGLAANAIAQLINAINKSNDAKVVAAGNNPGAYLNEFLQGD